MAFVTGALGSVISKLGLLLMEEYNLQTGVRKKITCLSRDLQSIYAALSRVAEVPPDQLDNEVKLWARDVRELSYDVEDILDRFLVRVDGHEEASDKQSSFLHAAKKVSKFFSRSKARHQIAGMIKIIDKQAGMVAERHRRYRAADIVSKPAATSDVDPRLEAMYKQVTELVGIEKPSAELICMLSLSHASDKKMKTVSIVGTGGLGKTTLAKAVYDKMKVEFQCWAFVPVGRRPDLRKVFRDILIDLDKCYVNTNMTILDERQLINELREYLRNKRYFIVIDDIWETKSWEAIKIALVQDNCCGSRLITTTRKFEVATECGVIYKLKPLGYEKSRNLFYTRIFGAEDKYPDTQLDEASEYMLKKCDGVPLAIITMASLLVGKSREEWIEMCHSVVFHDKKKNRQVSDTEWILSLSYYDLPAHLKTCLLYLSAFPEDHVIRKDPLIRKWVAEGFVHKEPGTSLFEVGERYFNELVNRSMMQIVVSQEHDIIIGCRLHDMVLDLLRLKSQEENFITISRNIVEGTSPQSRVRRLAKQDKMVQQTIQHGTTRIDLRHMRTFIACRCDVTDEVLSFQRFQLLRVLALEHCNVGNNLENVGSLLHLRYLELKRIGDFELPKGIEALKFLQTLDLGWGIVRELPSSVGLLSQLTCLRARDTKVPNGTIEKLTSLEELQIVVRNNTRGQFVKDLGKLRELMVLNCIGLLDMSDKKLQSDLVESLGHLQKIRHLMLFGRCKNLDKAIWDMAVFPRRLRSLILPGMDFIALPSCINSTDLPILTHLDLSVREMDERGLKILGGLSELQHLKLRTFSTVTITTHATDGCFHKLKSFWFPISTVRFVLNDDTSVSFTIFNNWDDVVIFDSAKKGIVRAPAIMLNLQLIVFRVRVHPINCNCDKLGLEHLPSLQKVKVMYWCGGAISEREEAALRHAIEAHPNRPTLQIDFRGKHKMKS